MRNRNARPDRPPGARRRRRPDGRRHHLRFPRGRHQAFDAHDGQAVRYWLRAGHEAAILSGRGSKTIRRRAREIGIEHVYEDATDKLPVFEKILKRFGRTADRVCYVGDDLVDLPVMARVGFAVATAGAVDEVRRIAHYVTRRPGGAGPSARRSNSS